MEPSMSQQVTISLEVPTELERFKLPIGVHERLQELLDRQDQGSVLTSEERLEAEGLVTMAEMLSLIRLKAQRATGNVTMS
jgi:hypothetical protein